MEEEKLKTVGKVFDAVEKGIKAICIVLAAGFTITTLISVIARYILGAPIWWSEQFCRYLFIWMLMLYAPIIVRHNKNLGFDLVVSKLPAKAQDILWLLSETLVGVFGACYCVYTIQLCEKFSNKLMDGIRIPAPYMYSSRAVCGALLAIFSLELVINHIIAMKNGKKEGDSK